MNFTPLGEGNLAEGARSLSTDLFSKKAAKVFQALVRAAVETKFSKTTLGGQAWFCDLIGEFCAVWADSAVEKERHVIGQS